MNKMIWAVVRSDKVEAIAHQLKIIGVTGCTIYPVRGYGEQWRLYEPLIHGGHHKLEAIVNEEQVEKVVDEIAEHGSTGREGDGILSVFDLGPVVKIRLKQEVKNS
ncbi:MAG: P-II family nitrogen regulator [Candidatus Binatia bacterium]